MGDDPKPALTLDCIGLYCPSRSFRPARASTRSRSARCSRSLPTILPPRKTSTRFAKRAGHEVVAVSNDGGELHILLRRSH